MLVTVTKPLESVSELFNFGHYAGDKLTLVEVLNSMSVRRSELIGVPFAVRIRRLTFVWLVNWGESSLSLGDDSPDAGSLVMK